LIQRAFITAWRAQAPWSTDAQVEQDLVLSRALVELFSDGLLASRLALRGGTVLHKVFLVPPARYSEDIDLVQVAAGPIGDVMDAIRARLDPWLGKAQWKQGQGRVTLIYRFTSETLPVTPLRLKVETNTREHFSVLGLQVLPFRVASPWFSGDVALPTYRMEELLGTKLRALYQRKKGRDLFDLDVALRRYPDVDARQIVECFEEYLVQEGKTVSRRDFEANLVDKVTDPAFTDDVLPLLTVGLAPAFRPQEAMQRVFDYVLPHLERVGPRPGP
jgi:predicted nucleotidyltransferase component of viral defense system